VQVVVPPVAALSFGLYPPTMLGKGVQRAQHREL